VKFYSFFLKRDQSHVMINGDAHIFKGDNSSLYSSLQYEYYKYPRGYLWSCGNGAVRGARP
jgi:hypothetical protein